MEKNSLYKELHWSNGKIIESKTFNDDGTFTVYSHKEGEPDGIMKTIQIQARLISYAVKENGVYKSYNPDGEELYKSNSGSLLKGALQIFQQVAAYQVYEKALILKTSLSI